MSTQIPEDLKYAATHEWLRAAADGTATVGITDHAQHELTDIVFVELPKIGRILAASESCAVVESVKSASDIYSPAAGEVVAVTAALSDNPAQTNNDPYGAGWFFKLRLAAGGSANGLMDAAGYAKATGKG